MRTALLLLVLLVLLVGVGWLLFGPSLLTPPAEEGDGVLEDWELPLDREPPSSRPGPEPLSVPADPPPRVLARIAVLDPDRPLPRFSAAEVTACEGRVEALRLPVGTRGIGGADLLEAVAEAIYVRARSRRDLEELRRLWITEEGLGGRAELRFGDVVDLWMREGFRARVVGAFLVVEDERREERHEVPPPEDRPPEGDASPR